MIGYIVFYLIWMIDMVINDLDISRILPEICERMN